MLGADLEFASWWKPSVLDKEGLTAGLTILMGGRGAEESAVEKEERRRPQRGESLSGWFALALHVRV